MSTKCCPSAQSTAGGHSQAADQSRATFDFYALEGAYSSGVAIVGLQLGAFDIEEDDFYYQDGTFARASANCTLANGGMISGHAAYFDGCVDPDGKH